MSFRLPAPAPAVRVMLSFAFGRETFCLSPIVFGSQPGGARWRSVSRAAGLRRTTPDLRRLRPHGSRKSRRRPPQLPCMHSKTCTGQQHREFRPRLPPAGKTPASACTRRPHDRKRGNQATQKHKKTVSERSEPSMHYVLRAAKPTVWPHYLFQLGKRRLRRLQRGTRRHLAERRNGLRLHLAGRCRPHRSIRYTRLLSSSGGCASAASGASSTPP